MARDGLQVLPDPEALGRAAAAAFCASARAAIEARGRFSVALSGGSTPLVLDRELVRRAVAELDWRAVHFFWSDERTVPPGDPESNYGVARRELLDPLRIPEGNRHRMRGEDPDPRRAAADYEEELRRYFDPVAGEVPRFDLVYLGLGRDGHTASLFPGSPALDERERWVVANPVPALGATRLTLTYPVLSAAAEVHFLVAGEGKAAVLREVLEGAFEPRRLPAQGVRPAAGALRWWVDEAAAGALARG